MYQTCREFSSRWLGDTIANQIDEYLRTYTNETVYTLTHNIVNGRETAIVVFNVKGTRPVTWEDYDNAGE